MLDVLRNRWVMLALRLGISIALLSWALAQVDVRSVWTFLSSANPWLFLAAVCVFMGTTALMASQLSRIVRLHGVPLSSVRLLAISLRAAFYSFALPGDVSGGLVKWYLISKGGHRVSALASILYVRIINLITMLLVGGLALLAKRPFENRLLAPLLLALLVLLIACTIGLHMGVMEYLARRLFSLKVLSRIHAAAWAKARDEILRVLSVIRAFGWRDILTVFTYSFAGKILVVFAIWILSCSVGVTIPFFVLLWVHSGVELVQMLPISFSGIGVRDIAFIVMLKAVDVPGEGAMAVALGCLALRLVPVALGGILVLTDSASAREAGESDSESAGNRP